MFGYLEVAGWPRPYAERSLLESTIMPAMATGLPFAYDTCTDQCIPANVPQMQVRSASDGRMECLACRERFVPVPSQQWV